MFRIGLFILSVVLLQGCAATTPVVLAGGGSQQVLQSQQDIRLRAAAALEEEGDLLTFSVKAIAENHTEQVVNTYLKGYTDPKYSQAIKSLAIYQIGLVYMNRLNKDRDDQKAKQYFKRHQIEFPNSLLSDRIEKRLAIIEKRTHQPIQLSADELIKRLDKKALLKKPFTPYDGELTPMSERAIAEERLEDAESVYTVVYQNPGSSAEIKAKALYQLGLIYMSPYNQQGNERKAIQFFRKIVEEFPKSKVAHKAELRITELHNRT